MANLTRDYLKYIRGFEGKIMHEHLSELKHPQIGSIVGYENQIRIAVLKDEMEIWRERLESGDTTTLENRVKELEDKEKVSIEERVERWREEIKESSTEEE